MRMTTLCQDGDFFAKVCHQKTARRACEDISKIVNTLATTSQRMKYTLCLLRRAYRNLARSRTVERQGTCFPGRFLRRNLRTAILVCANRTLLQNFISRSSATMFRCGNITMAEQATCRVAAPLFPVESSPIASSRSSSIRCRRSAAQTGKQTLSLFTNCLAPLRSELTGLTVVLKRWQENWIEN